MKIKNLLTALLITVLAISVGYASPPTTKTTTEKFVVEKAKQTMPIVAVYYSQIGVRELTGHNDGKQVEMYLSTVGLGRGNPWCAAFVKYCYLKANIVSAKQINGMALSVNTYGKKIFYKQTFIEEPNRGDAFTLYYPSLARIGHTGFYDGRLTESLYKTVEGNTNGAGSREGDGVYRKYRSFKATYSINRFT